MVKAETWFYFSMICGTQDAGKVCTAGVSGNYLEEELMDLA